MWAIAETASGTSCRWWQRRTCRGRCFTTFRAPPARRRRRAGAMRRRRSATACTSSAAWARACLTTRSATTQVGARAWYHAGRCSCLSRTGWCTCGGSVHQSGCAQERARLCKAQRRHFACPRVCAMPWRCREPRVRPAPAARSSWRAAAPAGASRREAPPAMFGAAAAAVGHRVFLFGGRQGRKYMRRTYVLDTGAARDPKPPGHRRRCNPKHPVHRYCPCHSSGDCAEAAGSVRHRWKPPPPAAAQADSRGAPGAEATPARRRHDAVALPEGAAQ